MTAHLVMGLIEGLKAILGGLDYDPKDKLVNDPYLKLGIEMYDNGKSGLSIEEYYKSEISKPHSKLQTAITTILLYMELKKAIQIEFENIMEEIRQMNEEERRFAEYKKELIASIALLDMQQSQRAEEERLLSQKKSLENYIAQIDALVSSYAQVKQELIAVQGELNTAQFKLNEALAKYVTSANKIYESNHNEMISILQNQERIISHRLDNVNEKLMRARNELSSLSQGRAADDPLVVQKTQEVAELEKASRALNDVKSFKHDFREDENNRKETAAKFDKLSLDDLKGKGVASADVTPERKALKDVMMSGIRDKAIEIQSKGHNIEVQKMMVESPELSALLKSSDIILPEKSSRKDISKELMSHASAELAKLRENLGAAQQRKEQIESKKNSIKSQMDEVAINIGKLSPRSHKQTPPAQSPPRGFHHN